MSSRPVELQRSLILIDIPIQIISQPYLYTSVGFSFVEVRGMLLIRGEDS